MKLIKLLGLFIFTFSLMSCTTSLVDEPGSDFREPAAAGSVRCENLFDQKTKKAKAHLEETKSKIASRLNLKFATELLPASVTEAFWDTVVQLSNNNDSRIILETHQFVLTKNYSENLKIHSTYTYDNPSNSFLISKLEYSTPEIKHKLISDSPLDPATKKFKSDLLLNIESVTPVNGSITIADHVDYKVYEKIFKETKNLDLFTTYELSKLYKLSPAARSLKYNALSRARSLRKFFTENIVNDYLYVPVKFIAVTMVSVFIISHVDFVRNVVSKTNQTPNWVAPSVVKMAVAYPKQVQPELVSLIKRIEYQEKSENADASEVQGLVKQNELVKIDEADQFSIEVEPNTKKTYFFVSHQQESGTIDIYATEINPVQYPNLIGYFKARNK